jgi:hypothetical protein
MRTADAPPLTPEDWAELVRLAKAGERLTCQGTTDEQEAELDRIATAR